MRSISPFARSYIRRRATHGMTDACRIVRPGADRVDYVSPPTHITRNALGSEIYNGPCLIWAIPTGGQVVVLGEEMVMSTHYLSLPFDAPTPQIEDQAQLTVSEDPALVGRHVKILSISRGGGLRASRLMNVQFIERKDAV